MHSDAGLRRADIPAEPRDHGAFRRIDLVDAGRCPDHEQCSSDGADPEATGATAARAAATVAVAASAAAKDSRKPALKAAQRLVEIRGAPLGLLPQGLRFLPGSFHAMGLTAPNGRLIGEDAKPAEPERPLRDVRRCRRC